LEEYEKEKKQEIIGRLKQKKLNSLVNHFEEIWSHGNNSANPLQSLLNNIRRG
jgi:predicted transcriptional regulator